MIQYKTINLGEMVAALQALPADAVILDTDGTMFSYRGYYDQLALNLAPGEQADKDVLLTFATAALAGQTFHGYRGGEYLATDTTAVFVAAFGETSDLRLMGFRPSNAAYEIEVVSVVPIF
jgi:hypothetical protein